MWTDFLYLIKIDQVEALGDGTGHDLKNMVGFLNNWSFLEYSVTIEWLS